MGISVMRKKTPREYEWELERLENEAKMLKAQNQIRGERFKSQEYDQAEQDNNMRNQHQTGRAYGETVPRYRQKGYQPPSRDDTAKIMEMIQGVDKMNLEREKAQSVIKQNALNNEAMQMKNKTDQMRAQVEAMTAMNEMKQQEEQMALARNVAKKMGLMDLDDNEAAAAGEAALNSLAQTKDRSESSKAMSLLEDSDYDVVLGGDLLGGKGITAKLGKKKKEEDKTATNKRIRDMAEKMLRTEQNRQTQAQGGETQKASEMFFSEDQIEKYLPAAKKALGVKISKEEEQQIVDQKMRTGAVQALQAREIEPTEEMITRMVEWLKAKGGK